MARKTKEQTPKAPKEAKPADDKAKEQPAEGENFDQYWSKR